MVSEIEQWQVGRVDCPDTAIFTKVAEIRGGQSVTIKSLATAGQSHEISESKTRGQNTGYKLDSGETMSFSLPKSFGEKKVLEVFARPSNAGDDVCFAKLIDMEPEISSTGSG